MTEEEYKACRKELSNELGRKANFAEVVEKMGLANCAERGLATTEAERAFGYHFEIVSCADCVYYDKETEICESLAEDVDITTAEMCDGFKRG